MHSTMSIEFPTVRWSNFGPSRRINARQTGSGPELHYGLTDMNGLRLTRLPHERSEADKRALQNVYADAPLYCMRVVGHIPTLDEMRPVQLPPGKTPEDDYFFGVYLRDQMIGCADLLRGYPDEKTAYLGLVLISERYQNRRLGVRACMELEKVALSWPEISIIRGSVVQTNEVVLKFWERLGAVDTGVRRPYSAGEIQSQAIVFEKKLVR
jgi:RimJ/RimL family protein N-acetyltransferase